MLKRPCCSILREHNKANEKKKCSFIFDETKKDLEP